jgi:stage II sporulation protein AA (anti-sigma F factor antagonist)
MDIQIEELPGQATKVALRGRLDSTGAVEIELPFNAVATDKRAVVVDLTGVTVLASYGVRVLLVGAKLCAAKGGRLVILCPDGHVAKVLRIARFDALAPIVDSEVAALAALA